MEEKKKNHNKGGQGEGGQRISVRPGNFAPPAQPASAPSAQGSTPERTGGGNRHKHGRHGRHQNRPKPNAPERQNNQQNQPKPDNGAKNQENKSAPPRHERGHHARHRRDENRAAEPKNTISETLQKELNEEFGTPTL